MIQEMPANGHWEESPDPEHQQQPTLTIAPDTMITPLAETVGENTMQNYSEVTALSEDMVQVTGDDRTGQS